MKKILYILLLLIPCIVLADSGYDGCLKWDYEDGVLTFSQNSGVCKYTQYYDNHSWNHHKNEIKKIIIPQGVDVIDYQSFQNMPNLEEVILPKTMGGQINNYAFANCPKLTHIDLPFGLTKIGAYAFQGTGITEVEVPVTIGWIESGAFPPDTVITRPAEYENLIAAGTAGNLERLGYGNIYGGNEGRDYEGTCYNKFYYNNYYDDTAFWKLYKDGTLLVYGEGLNRGYSNSRNPWGCYKKKIKRMIFNIDKTGTITKQNQMNPEEKLPNAIYGIYSTKPVEEIMSKRINKIEGNMFLDCRESCDQSSYNIESITINRGVETVKEAFTASQEIMPDKDYYFNKYIKTIEEKYIFLTNSSNPQQNRVHLAVSPEDYINNNYDYKLHSDDDIFDGSSFVSDIPIFADPSYEGSIVNDIDEYYVSINDNLAPKQIEVDGQTLYLYDTYRTNGEGKANISIADGQDLVYYVKEIQPPEGYELDPNVYQIDMSNQILDIVVSNMPLDSGVLSEENLEQHDNPLTKDNIIAIVALFSFSIILILYNYHKGHEMF